MHAGRRPPLARAMRESRALADGRRARTRNADLDAARGAPDGRRARGRARPRRLHRRPAGSRLAVPVAAPHAERSAGGRGGRRPRRPDGGVPAHAGGRSGVGVRVPRPGRGPVLDRARLRRRPDGRARRRVHRHAPRAPPRPRRGARPRARGPVGRVGPGIGVAQLDRRRGRARPRREGAARPDRRGRRARGPADRRDGAGPIAVDRRDLLRHGDAGGRRARRALHDRVARRERPGRRRVAARRLPRRVDVGVVRARDGSALGLHVDGLLRAPVAEGRRAMARPRRQRPGPEPPRGAPARGEHQPRDPARVPARARRRRPRAALRRRGVAGRRRPRRPRAPLHDAPARRSRRRRLLRPSAWRRSAAWAWGWT